MSLRSTLLLSAATLIGRAYSQCAPFDTDAPGAPIASSTVTCSSGGSSIGTDVDAPVGTECTVACDTDLYPQVTGPQYVCQELVPALGNGCAEGFAWVTPEGFEDGITCTTPSCESFVDFAADDELAQFLDSSSCVDTAAADVANDAVQAIGNVCSIDSCRRGYVAINSASADRQYTCTFDGQTSIGTYERSSAASADPCLLVVCPEFNDATSGVANSRSIGCFADDQPTPTTGLTVSAECRIECDADLLLRGSDSYFCRAASDNGIADTAVGVWDPITFRGPECNPVECDAFRFFEFERPRGTEGVTPTANGCTGGRDPNEDSPVFNEGDRCTFTCSANYVLTDPALNEYECARTRFGTAEWVPVNGAGCLPDVTCEPFEDFVSTNNLQNIDQDASMLPVTNCTDRFGTSVGLGQDGATVNSVCEVACNEDFSFVDSGATSYTCEAPQFEPPFTGEWRGSAMCDDSCVGPTTSDGFVADLNNVPANAADALTCIEPSSPTENDLLGETFEIGTVCTLNCNAGTSPFQGESYTCGTDGAWEGQANCAPNCPSPMSTFDSSVFAAGATVNCGDDQDLNAEAPIGRRCFTTCPPGFGVTADRAIATCESDGTTSRWSNIPQCAPVECPAWEAETANIENAVLGMCNDGSDNDADICVFDEPSSSPRPINTTCEVTGCVAGFRLNGSPEDRFFRCEQTIFRTNVGAWRGAREPICVSGSNGSGSGSGSDDEDVNAASSFEAHSITVATLAFAAVASIAFAS